MEPELLEALLSLIDSAEWFMLIFLIIFAFKKMH